MMEGKDPRVPLLVGIALLGVLIVAGIVWAVFFIPEDAGRGRIDYNASFNDEGDPSFGPADAKVVVRMFEDFQCPACKAAKAGLDYAKRTYGDRVKFVWNDFPLEQIHKNARAAANAARCAEAQGKFWEMNDLLYDFQSNWAELRDPTDELMKLAEKIEINPTVWLGCLKNKEFDDKISADSSEARANRVDSTPTFFIGNKRIIGGLTPAQWDGEIKAQLGE